MMTTGSVFGGSDINNRPEFGGIDPRIEEQKRLAEQRLANEAIEIEKNKARLLQDAISKFLNKEITKAELESIQESLK